jgi:hypothetical protein
LLEQTRFFCGLLHRSSNRIGAAALSRSHGGGTPVKAGVLVGEVASRGRSRSRDVATVTQVRDRVRLVKSRICLAG